MQKYTNCHIPLHYAIDWDKIQTLEDIKRVIKSLDIRLTEEAYAESDIKDLLKLMKKL